MKVALIADLHANLPALEAVLAHAEERGAEAIWNVGDFLGYGAFPEQVVQQLRKEYVLSTIGDYDRKVLRFKKRREKWRRSKGLERFLAFQWAYQQLSKRSRKYLRFLSRVIRMTVESQRILLAHANPGSGKVYLAPDTPEQTLSAIAHQVQADIVILGHSHRAVVRQVDGVWFINPGSVGRPDDGDPRASYAALEIEPQRVHVEHYRVDYDVQRLVQALRENGLPEAFAQMFLQGRNLDAILDATLEPTGA
jgi:putative phosphoesterase